MAFINFPNPTPIFPKLPPQAWSVHKEPSFVKTPVATAISGREYQIARQTIPRWLFTLTYGGDAWLRDQTENASPYGPLAGCTELETIAGLYVACLGAYGEFYFEDPEDNSRLNQAVGVAVTGTFLYPLFFQWGNGPFTPPALYPVGGIKTLDEE